MRKIVNEHPVGFAVSTAVVISSFVIVLSVWSLSNGISLQAMDLSAGVRLSWVLGSLGLWLTILAPTVLFAGYLSHEGFNRCIPSLFLWTSLFALAASLMLSCIGLSPPMEAMAVIDGIVGVLVFRRTPSEDRGMIILSVACMFLSIIVVSSWWVMSFGAAHVMDVALNYSQIRTPQSAINDMEHIRRFAPIYTNAMMYVGCLPIMLVTVFGSVALASLPDGRAV